MPADSASLVARDFGSSTHNESVKKPTPTLALSATFDVTVPAETIISKIPTCNFTPDQVAPEVGTGPRSVPLHVFTVGHLLSSPRQGGLFTGTNTEQGVTVLYIPTLPSHRDPGPHPCSYSQWNSAQAISLGQCPGSSAVTRTLCPTNRPSTKLSKILIATVGEAKIDVSTFFSPAMAQWGRCP